MKQENEGKLQIELLKVVAEQQQENFLEYDLETDTATLSRVMNGQFVVQEIIEGYYANEDLSFSRIAEEDRDEYKKLVAKCMKRPRQAALDLRMLNGKGEKLWYRLFLISIAGEDRKVCKITGRFLPIHKEKIANEMIRLQAERDSMTGVYNHKTYENLSQELIISNPNDTMFIMLDVDDFKHINDTKGHHVGDMILKKVGTILSDAVQGLGYAGRMGGDEFSACIRGVNDKSAAAAFCLRLKDAMRYSDDGTLFSISIGAARSLGRNTNFMELYHEADEAVYFAKQSGKNQIVLAEDVPERKLEKIRETNQDMTLSEEEITLDQSLEYHAIMDPETKKLLYLNKPARNVMGISLKEAKELRCYELFHGNCKECEVCDLFAYYVHVLENESAKGLGKYIPDGKFIVQSKYMPWKGKPARSISFLNVNDTQHIEKCFVREMNSQDTINKCWSVMMNTSSQDTDYVKILEIINRYYDADCTAIVTKNEDKYEEIFEYHKETAQQVVAGLSYAKENGKLEDFEVLINQDGLMIPHHIENELTKHPQMAKALDNLYVRNTLGIRLMRLEEFIGILLVINPRHYVNDIAVLKRIGLFFTTDLLRRRLVHDQTYGGTHDLLTKLWNREYFTEWNSCYGHLFKGDFGVFVTDIVNLRNINKEFGYDHGNRRLVEVADMYKRVFAGYSVFRFDNDQMVAICHEIDKASFEKIVKYAKEQIREFGFEVAVGYCWARDGVITNKIKEAEAMKDVDKARILKDGTINQKTNKYVETDILKEIHMGNFRVYLQPKVNVHTGKTVGAEALIRLWDEKRGIIPPGYFIPILEERHVIHMIDLYVLKESMRFQKQLLNKGETPVVISVNFSKNTLMFEGLLDYIKELCFEFALPEGLIQLEITESISSMDHIVVTNIANSLRSMGFSISMDDFGTKYSNMAVLNQFHFDSVKIDRSMVMDIEKNPDNVTILKHMLEMFKELGLSSVIEGVETQGQVNILRKLDCEMVQGYYFGRPEPKEKFYELYMK